MSAKLGCGAAVVVIASLAMAGPKGTLPRSSADKYALHAVREKFSIGVVTLSPEQATVLGNDAAKSYTINGPRFKKGLKKIG